ncbi:methionine--tRNA ligase [Candidatus Peregrinibacteria bacterium]|nr:methionine--tRNA ligase [Candidatus Peregrinibacteria bacterium]
MTKFYLTNAIAYTNAGPHIGHLLEAIQGDALTRYHRLQEHDTRFLVGTDEHGTKMSATAKEKGVTPQALADENSEIFRDLHVKFNCANDDFIRTTDDLHKRGAQKLWKMIDAAGKFYEKEYEGLYCSGCEAFVVKKDLVDGNCPNHARPPELLKETNIFFKLSEYTDVLREKIESNDFVIKPQSRRNEILSFLKEGLHDVSFSRPKSSLAWGVDVPGRDDQVMYVWGDALSNYLTALGFADDDALVEQYWPADVHLVGKDITRFHCLIWPAMLLAAGLEMPKAVYAHGFITSEGQKMSKSIGNVVDPFEILEEWGVDPVRYFLLREIPTGDDGDFSKERFAVVYKDELQNTIGNLVRRVVAMTIKYFDGVTPEGNDDLKQPIADAWSGYESSFEDFNIKKAIEHCLDLARVGNSYVDDNKPWELAKTDMEALKPVLANLIALCTNVGYMLQAIIPESAEKILEQVTGETVTLGEQLFPHKE